MADLITLCWEFFKTGLFAVGGGLATLPFLVQMQTKYQWFTAEQLANMIAISESTPGPIGVNMATYVGFEHGGVLSALLATLSLVLPSVIIIIAIASAMERFQKSRLLEDMFMVIRPAVTGLIAAAGFQVLCIALFREAPDFLHSINWTAVALFAALTAATQIKKLKKLHPVVFIAAGALLGVIFQM